MDLISGRNKIQGGFGGTSRCIRYGVYCDGILISKRWRTLAGRQREFVDCAVVGPKYLQYRVRGLTEIDNRYGDGENSM